MSRVANQRHDVAASDDWMASGEVARMLGISVSALAEMRKKSQGPIWYQPAGHARYKRADVEAYLRNAMRAPAGTNRGAM